ncbi:hypothetical protein Gotur_013256 [Gossypium turneri]
MINQLTQLLVGGNDKGKSPVVDSGVDHEDPVYPPKGGLIKQDSTERPEGTRKYCEFHAKNGHDIQKCVEFRTMVQNLMDKKELEFMRRSKG